MAEGKLRQVELDAYRITTRRFQDQEEERLRAISEQAVKGQLAQETEDQLVKENIRADAPTQFAEGDVTVDTKELFKPEQHVVATPAQQNAAPVVQPVPVKEKSDEKKSEKKDTK